MTPVIAVFDPASGSSNLGDQIIIEACIQELLNIAPGAFIFKVSLHQPLTSKLRQRIADADLVVVAGSNMLNTRVRMPPSLTRWRFSLRDATSITNVILMGVGWNRSTDWVNPIGSYILRRGLSGIHMHSVRDDMTVDKARQVGLSNIVNTNCPTLWRIDTNSKKGGRYHHHTSRSAVVTLTFNDRSPTQDALMLQVLAKECRRLYFWPQSGPDAEYLMSLNPPSSVIVLPGTLSAYDRLLQEEEDLIYVGTRLHGGIRAVQQGRPAIIVAIDHRSEGVAGSAGLTVVNRSEIETLSNMINGLNHPEITLPFDNIRQWRESTKEVLFSK